MPAPLAPGKRAAILEDIEAGQSCRATARKHGVAQSTVSKLAKDHGLGFERSQTKKATEAAQIDHAAVLAKLAARHAAVAGNILASFEAMELEDWGRVSPHTRAVALGICSDKARELAPDNDEAQVEAARSLLNVVFEDIMVRHGEPA
jgi:transposase-like protein